MVDGNAKMPMALHTQRDYKGVKISEANAWRMVSNATTSRETSADHATRIQYTRALKKLGFEEEKGQLREWMTVARDRSAWDRKLKNSVQARPSSRLIHESRRMD
jgi:hypothetical protein